MMLLAELSPDDMYLKLLVELWSEERYRWIGEPWPDNMYLKLLVELWSEDRYWLLAEFWPDDMYLKLPVELWSEDMHRLPSWTLTRQHVPKATSWTLICGQATITSWTLIRWQISNYISSINVHLGMYFLVCWLDVAWFPDFTGPLLNFDEGPERSEIHAHRKIICQHHSFLGLGFLDIFNCIKSFGSISSSLVWDF